MTATIHVFPLPAPIRCVDEAPPIRAHAENFMLTLRAHPHAGRIPTHLYLALVEVLDAIVDRAERPNG